MNLDVRQIGGDLLLVPQFTLAADTSKAIAPGSRPRRPAEQARQLFEALLGRAAGASSPG